MSERSRPTESHAGPTHSGFGQGVAHLLTTGPRPAVETHSVTQLLKVWNIESEAPVEDLVEMVRRSVLERAGGQVSGAANGGITSGSIVAHEPQMS